MEEKSIIINPTKILCEDIPETAEKIGSIIVPTTARIPSMKAKILQIGCGTDYIKISHKVGDIALFSPRAGQEIEVNGKKLRLMDVNDVWLSGTDDTISRFGVA